VFTTQTASSWRPDQNVCKLWKELDTSQPGEDWFLPTLNISDILRHLAIGFIAFGLALVVEPVATRAALSAMGPGGSSLAAFTLGVLVYNMYRPLLLMRIIHRLKDFLAGSNGNHRRFLLDRYGMPRRDAEYFWHHVRATLTPDRVESLRRDASAIHFLYMTSLLMLVATAYSALHASYSVAAVLLGVGLVTGSAGLVQDLDFERLEYFTIRGVDSKKLDDSAAACGYKRRIVSKPHSAEATTR
jgi:hypothetical protein